jgi:hypothetical protein
VVVAAAAWATDLAEATRTRVRSPDLVAVAERDLSTRELRNRQNDAMEVELYAAVNEAAGDGAVLVNDHMFLLLDAPPVNTHALHSDVWDYRTLDLEGFIAETRDRDVRAVVFRPGISGIEPVVLEYLAACGELIDVESPVDAYVVSPECRRKG